MHPSQFNNSSRNVNHLSGHVSDMNMKNHNMMPNAMPQSKMDNNRQTHNSTLNTMIQNLNKQNHNISHAMTQDLMDNNRKMHNLTLITKAKNFNKEDHSTISNFVTQSLKRNSSLTMNDILNKFVDGQNSVNSLFTSGHNLSPQSNFKPTLNCNSNNSKNEIYPNINQTNSPLFDKQKFSNNRSSNTNGGLYSNIVSAGKSHVKVKKNLNSDSNEFKMSNKDFPALPGTKMQMENVINIQSSTINSSEWCGKTNIAPRVLNNPIMDQYIDYTLRNSSRSLSDTDFHMNGITVPSKPEVKISFDDGKVTNIPSNMVHDQFGIIGHLISIKSAEHDPNLVTLTYGEDLKSLGLNLNSPENIYPSFAGPFEDFPLGPHNIDFDVPPEYRVHSKIKDKLAPIKLSEYKEDLLFYLFYSYYGETTQISAADELRIRGWSYHVGKCLWIIPVSGSSMFETDFSSDGTFYVFDPKLWRKVLRKLINP